MTKRDIAAVKHGEPAAGSPMLAVDSLGVQIDGEPIIHDVSFTAARGELVAIVGPNGAGKTVLLRTLIGRIPYTGAIRWGAGAVIGYVPQKLDLARDLPVTVHDLLRARARLAGAPASAITSAMARVDLPNDAGVQRIGALSGGQVQRLLIALALLAVPTVLLCDEPTSGIDAPGQARVNDVLRQLQREGVTILMISHDLSVVTRLATKAVCLTRDHRCLTVPARALDHDLISDVYGEEVGLFVHDAPRA